MERPEFYQIDMQYVRYLSEADDRVMSLPSSMKKDLPFIGLGVMCGGKNYFIPVNAPKQKHLSMKNDVDLIRMYDNEKLIGVLNFNNMVPVDESVIKLFSVQPGENDDPDTLSYKKLTSKQLTWCRKHRNAIGRKADKLYHLVTEKSGRHYGIKERCCDFKKLEEMLENRSPDK